MEYNKAKGMSIPSTVNSRERGITGSTLKMIAIITMLIDHIGASILTRMLLEQGMAENLVSSEWFAEHASLYYLMITTRLIGRLGFPLFAFLLVEGFSKTHNRKKYLGRMALFCILSEIPFDLAFSGKVLEFGYQNVYFTLFLGLLAMCAFDYIAKMKTEIVFRVIYSIGGVLLPAFYFALRFVMGGVTWKAVMDVKVLVMTLIFSLMVLSILLFYYRRFGLDRTWRFCADLLVLFSVMFAAELLRTDYSGMGVLTIAAMYAFREKKLTSILSGCIVLNIMSLSEITSFFTLLTVARYNGERGWKGKYFFYLFYPVHLLIIWLICYLMGTGFLSVI